MKAASYFQALSALRPARRGGGAACRRGARALASSSGLRPGLSARGVGPERKSGVLCVQAGRLCRPVGRLSSRAKLPGTNPIGARWELTTRVLCVRSWTHSTRVATLPALHGVLCVSIQTHSSPGETAEACDDHLLSSALRARVGGTQEGAMRPGLDAFSVSVAVPSAARTQT